MKLREFMKKAMLEKKADAHHNQHTPKHLLKQSAAQEDLFHQKVEKSDGCWKWTGAKNSDGYPAMKWDGKVELASHIAWKLHHGKLPGTDDVLCHTCDNPDCVNPAHMIKGDQADNLRDMRAKGRSRPGGEKQPPSGEKKAGVEQLQHLTRGTRRLPKGIGGVKLSSAMGASMTQEIQNLQ